MNTLQLFTTLLIVQIFWSLSVSLIVPVMPNATSNQLVMFNNSNNVLEIDTLQSSIDQGISDQTSIPLLETGALIFYSSATILNIMVNFFTAIPQMATLLVDVVFKFITTDAGLVRLVKEWVFAVIAILYAIALFAFITGSRTNLGSGSGIF